MAFFTLDDLSGSCECLMFAKVYEQYSRYIEEEECVFITGRPESSGDAIKLHIEKVISPNEARNSFTESIKIVLDKEKNNVEQLEAIDQVLSRHKGNLPFFIHVINNGSKQKVFQFKDRRVKLTDELLKDLVSIVGEDSVMFNSKR